MSAEVGDWLAGLAASEPATAVEVGAALLAVMNAAGLSGLALVREPSSPRDPREAADLAYQRLLSELRQLRATSTGTAQDRDLIDRLQLDVDAFRAAKETAKAMYTAAQASLRIRAAVAAASAAGLPPGIAQAAGESEPADLGQAVAAAEEHLRSIARQAEQTLRGAGRPAGSGQPTSGGQPEPAGQRGEPARDLLELQADTLGVDIRILIAQEPPDAVTVLAVLEGEAAVIEQRDRALDLAAADLAAVRAGALVELAFSDGAEFLARFFPAAGREVAGRAAGLAGAQTLAGLRHLAGKDPAEVAARSGVSEERLGQFEEAGIGSALVGDTVRNVRALGGRLTLTVRFSGEEPVVLA